jgi:hypothetical protein
MVAVKTYHILSNVEKEKLVIDLYYNQQKNVQWAPVIVKITEYGGNIYCVDLHIS